MGIDTYAESTPQKTIPKMKLVRAAALAPRDPSSTYYQVASTATRIDMQARLKLSLELRKELAEKTFQNMLIMKRVNLVFLSMLNLFCDKISKNS